VELMLGTGHFAPIAQPVAFNQTVFAFLAGKTALNRP
jgi:hypothetical protein